MRTVDDINDSINSCWPQLYRDCFEILQNADDASDAAYSAVAKVIENLGRYQKERGKFCTWLRAIGRYAAIDILRDRRRISVSLDAFPEGDGILPISDPHPGGIIRDGIMAHLQECIDQLSPQQRQVVLLKHFEDLNWTDVAVVMGRTVAQVRYLHQDKRSGFQTGALPSLRRCLESKGYDQEILNDIFAGSDDDFVL